MLLKLHGEKATYEEIESQLPVTRSGSSITDMRAYLRAQGLNATILKATPETLLRCPLPLIAHHEEEKATTGHYVIVLATDSERVDFLDGTTAIDTTQAMTEFRKNWSGYVLVIEERPWWHRLFPVAFILGGVSVCLALWSWTPSGAHRHLGTWFGLSPRPQPGGLCPAEGGLT